MGSCVAPFKEQTSRRFTKHDQPYIPSVTSFRDAKDNVKHTSDAEAVRQITTYDNNRQPISEPAMDKTNRLSNQLRESPEQAKITHLMSEVQYAGMSVIDQARNAHLTSEAELKYQAGLQARIRRSLPRIAANLPRA